VNKTLLVVALLSTLLFTGVAGTQLVNLGKAAYEYLYMGEVPPDADTEPPKIEILSPENNTLYNTSNFDLHLNASVGDSTTAASRLLWDIQYEADWQPERVYVYERIPETNMPILTEFSTTINLTGIPDGKHIVKVFATERGQYEELDPNSAGFLTLYYVFEITGSSSVILTIDTKPPQVTILSPENKVYDAADVPLEFIVDDPASQLSYILDGQESVAIEGNITLSELSNGEHNLTLYAQDAAGNVGASETVYFTIAEPFPIVPVVTVSVIVAVVSIGLLVYFKKRKC
jgi:hypothetical protein